MRNSQIKGDFYLSRFHFKGRPGKCLLEDCPGGPKSLNKAMELSNFERGEKLFSLNPNGATRGFMAQESINVREIFPTQ